MAHLNRCWCGKLYRCDLEHPKTNKLTFMEEIHENNCPDYVLHGPLKIGPFLVIKSEKFETLAVAGPPAEKLAYKLDIKEILEANSVKDPAYGTPDKV